MKHSIRTDSVSGHRHVASTDATNRCAVAVSADRITTVKPGTDAAAAFAAGVIVGEGTFTIGRPTTFGCAVVLGATDEDTVEFLATYFGVGRVRWYARRKPHYDDEVSWTVRRLRDHVEVIVPFMDVHLPVSHKRSQYLAWREALLHHWEHGARRRRTCSAPGCDALHRAHGWCRHHLYAERGI
jgi:hypothetical protein